MYRIISWQQQRLTRSRAHALGHPQPALRCSVVSGIFFFFPEDAERQESEAVTRDHREADSSTLGPNLEGILTHSHWRRDGHTGFSIVCQLEEAKAESVAHYTAAGRWNMNGSLDATHIAWKTNLSVKKRLHRIVAKTFNKTQKLGHVPHTRTLNIYFIKPGFIIIKPPTAGQFTVTKPILCVT